jgi:hypothetical protein
MSLHHAIIDMEDPLLHESSTNLVDTEQHAYTDVVPIEDLFDFVEDRLDYMGAESFPASDPLPPPSAITPSRLHDDE